MIAFRLLPALLAVTLAACERGPSPDELVRRDRIRAETTDPAVTDAISDPILADRLLSMQDDSLRVRATPGPVQVTTPPDDGSPPVIPPAARCDGPLAPGAAWAGRLPPEFTPPPGARVVDAAGRDAPGCRIRYLRVQAGASPQALADDYAARARAAGYGVQRQLREGEIVLSGAHPDGRAYTLIASPAGRGAGGALIVNLAPAAP